MSGTEQKAAVGVTNGTGGAAPPPGLLGMGVVGGAPTSGWVEILEGVGIPPVGGVSTELAGRVPMWG